MQAAQFSHLSPQGRSAQLSIRLSLLTAVPSSPFSLLHASEARTAFELSLVFSSSLHFQRLLTDHEDDFMTGLTQSITALLNMSFMSK